MEKSFRQQKQLKTWYRMLLDAIKVTLDFNNSTFNNKHYRPSKGTAMGPHNACSYAGLAMTYFDHKVLDVSDRPEDIVFPAE